MNRIPNFLKRVAWRCLHPLVLRFSPCQWRSIDDLPPQGDEDEEWETRCVVVWQDAEHEMDQGVEVTNLAQIRDGDFHQERYLNPVWRTVMDAPIYTQNVKEQTGEALSDSHCLTRLVRVGDSVMARNGAEGMVREVCGIGVWIDCKDPALFSDRGNPIGVDWKDIISHANR